ncbi:ubiquitin-like protein Pup [Mobilicoccus pelagius]|uniref:Prokaryotic ubiquitin-like protein Pup n=1 Tax=Mobilicoccus pelagius NBRC 104925 TaxID=1089455 RepID=H5UTG1_9MICO|nr:ubiquitin-like protein Pup [Mobilicoccus pelagius]GAB49019.1 putative proteasome accessory factor [Mobilicoccus pelagius NBRC 104925]
MSGQEQIRPEYREGGDPGDTTPPPAPPTAERKAALDADIDSVLDEIDSVLEVNAEEFVRGFVQKGGE